MCQLKKIHNLKFENHVLFSRLSENLSWRYSHSALRECSKGGREEPEYRVFAEGEKKYIVKYQKITTDHKNRHLSGTNDFSTFLCVARCKSLGLLKLFL